MSINQTPMKTHLTLFIYALFAGFTLYAQTPPPVLPASEVVRHTTTAGRLLAKMVASIPAPIPATLKHAPALGVSLSQIAYGGACVGFSHWNCFNTAGPKPQYNGTTADAVALWTYCRAHDHDPDTDPTNPNDGTYPKIADKWFLDHGYVTVRDSWGILTEKQLRHYILNVGATPVAMYWYSGFDNPTPTHFGHGLIKRTGFVRGGHDINVFWYDQKTAMYWLQNSWGGYAPYDKFGQIVEMSQADMQKQMQDGGYAPTFTKAPRVRHASAR